MYICPRTSHWIMRGYLLLCHTSYHFSSVIIVLMNTFLKRLVLNSTFILSVYFQFLYLLAFGVELWWIVEAEGKFKGAKLTHLIFSRNTQLIFFHFRLQSNFPSRHTCWHSSTSSCPFSPWPCWSASAEGRPGFSWRGCFSSCSPSFRRPGWCYSWQCIIG